MNYSRSDAIVQWSRSIWNYIEVLKPRETALLTYTGLCAAVVAAKGYPQVVPLCLATLAVLMGSGGTNGLTNYIDREVDARMKRTQHRPLPSKRIFPADKMLPLAVFLVVSGLVVAWFLDPLCLLFGLLGVVASVTWRKKVTCVFPQGTIASCAPVLVGYIAVSHRLDITLLFLCILVGILVPIHVWSVMIANREDYMGAGIAYFPLSWRDRDVVKLILALSLLMYVCSIGLYWFGDLGLPYLIWANILGILMVAAVIRLLTTGISRDAWRLYKLTAFPYLGLIFLAMMVDLWLA